MHPVPVQRSSRRNSVGSFCASRSNRTRFVTMAAVSCLEQCEIIILCRVLAIHRPGNEHAGSTPYLQIAEVLGAENVLQRLSRGSFSDQLTQ